MNFDEGDYIALQKGDRIYIIHYQKDFDEGDLILALHKGRELIGEKVGAKFYFDANVVLFSKVEVIGENHF